MSAYESLNETRQFACRVIADHARATAFAIADGILPGNEGRSYVLRKIMRRAIYHGREHLGLKDAFFYKVCDLVVDNFSAAYPELGAQRDFIQKMVRLEEERFGNTLTEGLFRVNQNLSKSSFVDLLKRLRTTSVRSVAPDFFQTIGALDQAFKKWAEQESVQNTLKFLQKLAVAQKRLEESNVRTEELKPQVGVAEIGQFTDSEKEQVVAIEGGVKKLFLELAKLYDTYGTPKDLIRIELEGKGLALDEDLFNERFDAALADLQKQSAIGKTERKTEVSPIYAEVAARVGRNVFHGYETTRLENASVAAILDGDKELDALAEGAQGTVVLNETPFYAESGGQVGDTGILVRTASGSDRVSTASQEKNPVATAPGSDFSATVFDTYSPVPGLILHKLKIEKGSLKVGDTVNAIVDVEKRDATRRNHTATHLVHAALKEVLGTHVKQAGSVVAPNYLRFDFTHYQPMSDAEIREVEDLVNRYILQNEPVTTDLMALEDAMRTGAVAMFGEKYGAEVRVLTVGNGEFSRELCGGTHVRATGDIGSFKITADEAIASGVRRIRAITGFDAFSRFREDEVLIERSLDVLKTQRDQLPAAIERLQDELKRTRREIDDLKLKIATGALGGTSSNGDDGRDIAGVKVVGKIVDGLDANGMRQLSDTLLARLKSGVVVIGRRDDEKAGIIVRVSDDLTSRVKAGSVIKEIVGIVGGKGGGRPDMAEGGGPEPAKLDDAIDAAYKVIETFLTA